MSVLNKRQKWTELKGDKEKSAAIMDMERETGEFLNDPGSFLRLPGNELNGVRCNP